MTPSMNDTDAAFTGRTPGAGAHAAALDTALDLALSRALSPPALPPGFERRLHERLAADRRLAASATAAQADIAAAVARARAEHAQQLAALRAGHVRLRRHTLAVVVGAAFTTGVVVAWALPWVRAVLGVDLGLLVPALAVAVGMVSGALAWVERFGWPSRAAFGPLRRFLSR